MNALDADPELTGKWRKLNNDPEFLKWLGEIYELAGVPRMQLLREAYDVGDQWRVANFFRGFLASKIPPRQRTETRLPMESRAASQCAKPTSTTARKFGRAMKSDNSIKINPEGSMTVTRPRQ
jgi:hypothetical protein